MNPKKIKFIPFDREKTKISVRKIPVISIKHKMKKHKWLLENKYELNLFYKLTLRFLKNNDIQIKNPNTFKDKYLSFMYKHSDLYIYQWKKKKHLPTF